ncbi:MAG: hypothetical protein ABJJ69_15495 [Paracoccaceae bacterium]
MFDPDKKKFPHSVETVTQKDFTMPLHKQQDLSGPSKETRFGCITASKRVALATALAGLFFANAASAETLSEKVRKATERFADVAVAEAEGYSPIPCVSGAGGGAMGIHYVNSNYLTEDNNTLDLAKPEAVMYEPQADGSLVLLGVEYITFEGPAALEGHLLDYRGSPNRYGLDPYYEMHVWAHRENPAGPFVGMNSDVSCEYAGG